ncbi:organic cation transporter protein isoform X2 [Drosophila kikkawai]|uniref:Organic cation transporter protein isoform X2 n=1 Tax=Drosophila kikkawai TaxID=30033 RepID=A0A6P4IQS2_DROKI|nr:organic cation transporter protein isoform X3 [Drosophila kikkawai]
MSGVLRRGSLNFDCVGGPRDKGRGSLEANLYGGYRETRPGSKTPEISVIALDFRRYSEDLKKPPKEGEQEKDGEQLPPTARDLSQDADSDVISNFLGHYTRWSFLWTLLLCLFQLPTTFHLFMFVFQLTDMDVGSGEASPMLQGCVDLDELDHLHTRLLERLFGCISAWQSLWCGLLSIFQAICTFHIFVYVFQTAPKDFWCAQPDHLRQMSLSEWRNLSQTSNGCLLLDVDYSQVSYNGNQLINWPANASELGYRQCPHFEFSDVDGPAKTLVQEFELVCGRDILSLVETCFLVGAAAGAVLSGWISDRFGRRHTLMAFVTIQSVFGGILAFSTSVAMFMSLRVIIGFASMTVTVVSFVLVVELVSGKWRTIIGILNILPVAISYVLSAGLAYLIRDWRHLQLAISWPWLIMLSIWFWLPESPRWLLAQGRLDELCVLIERAARMNGTTDNLPSNYRKTLEAAVPRTVVPQSPPELAGQVEEVRAAGTDAADPAVTGHVNPLLVVFGAKYWRTTCLTLIIWLTLIIIYFGLTLHLSNLGGNVYINSAVAGTVEAASICISIVVVLKVGIRRSLIGYMLLPGLCCLATNLVPNQTGVIALATIAKCLIGANNAIIPTYTAMQYPTIVRNFGVGMGNLASGIALILVPFLWQLEHIDALLPLNIMGVSGLIGAIAISLMKDVE